VRDTYHIDVLYDQLVLLSNDFYHFTLLSFVFAESHFHLRVQCTVTFSYQVTLYNLPFLDQ
jgi:hypothetical protein